MSTEDSIVWFKQNFGAEIVEAVKDTPFDLDMLTAIALQETGFIWGSLRTKGLSRDRILELCVGDTLDGRSAFPRDKADLLTHPRGQAMFDVAKAALVDMAAHVPGYSGPAANPNKFCHGFGMFQYDIQFFKIDPDYFLDRRYRHFDQTLGKAIAELKSKLASVSAKLGWGVKTRLTDMEKAAVAIAYNRGSYNPAKGLKQGHKNSDGKYYGELFFDYMKLAQTVPMPASVPPAPGQAMQVVVAGSQLNLRSKPERGDNIVGKLPDGLHVTAFEAKDGFRRVTATLASRAVEGWASADFLEALAVPVPPPAPPPPAPPPPPPGEAMRVNVTSSQLNLRSKPELGDNIIGKLPDGAPVRAFETRNGFRRVTATLIGSAVEGWVSAQFLKT
jgi:hypothetical protein